MTEAIGVSLLGAGNVGMGVVRALHAGTERYAAAVGRRLELRHVLVRDASRAREGVEPHQVTTDLDTVLGDDSTSIVVELMGAEEPARSYIAEALGSGRHVVTANKEVIAKHGAALRDLAASVHPADAAIGFETAGHAGVFKGAHKLVRVGAPEGDGRWRLFNIEEDPGETRDLAADEPERLEELLADYEAYAERVGVREVPASYSPPRQLLINYLFDRTMANLGWLLASAGLGIVVIVALVKLIRQRRRTQPHTR